MTIRQVIEKVKQIRRPACADQDLLEEINRTEAEIYMKIVDPRGTLWAKRREEDPENNVYPTNDYTLDDMDEVLTAPRPFDEIYVTACLRYISRTENNITNLNNEEREYKELFGELAAWWSRTHRERGPRMRSWWYGV